MAEVQENTVDIDALKGVIEEEYNNDPENVIMILQDISARYNYLPKEALHLVSEKLEVPISLVYSVATFYKAFSLIPRGKNIINVCVGTACHVRGAERIMESIKDKLHVSEGGTTKDMKFSLESVRCLGCCALGPVITVNEKAHGGLDRSKVFKLIEEYEKQAEEKH